MPIQSGFAASAHDDRCSATPLPAGSDRKRRSNRSGASGQALVEFVLLFPVLFLLIVNAVNFGGFLFAWITIANAARNGTHYWATGGAAAGAPARPTVAQVRTLVTNDISSLVERSSLLVRACTNNNGTVTCSGSGTSVPPTDPEPATYVSASVDVTYTYRPFIPLWSFPSMNIYATLPAATVHSRGVMRVLQ
jgi:Flp pilus assembly protein TadG